MQMVRVEQGSPEWDDLHKGRITASMMDCVFAKDGTEKHDRFLHALASDLAGIQPLDDPRDEPWFEAGRELEPDAIMAFEMRHGVDTWRDAFLIHDHLEWLGCSPDALIGNPPTAGVEFKVRKTVKTFHDAIYTTLNQQYQRVSRGYYLQMQTAMAISGFDEWTYGNFYPGGEHCGPRLADRAILRDDAMIAEILDKATGFYADAIQLAETL